MPVVEPSEPVVESAPRRQPSIVPTAVVLPHSYESADTLLQGMSPNDPSFNRMLKLSDECWLLRARRPANAPSYVLAEPTISIVWHGITCVIFCQSGWTFLNTEGCANLRPISDIFQRITTRGGVGVTVEDNGWATFQTPSIVVHTYQILADGTRGPIIRSNTFRDFMAYHAASSSICSNPFQSPNADPH